MGKPLQVAVADGVIHASAGTCRVCLKLQQFSADLACDVVELADAYEIIFAEDWLCKYTATVAWGHSCCVLTKSSQRNTLVPGPQSDLDEPVQSVPGAYAAPITAVQAGKAMANGCRAFLAVCIDAQTVADAACAAMHSDTAVSGTDQSQLMLESELNALLHEYHNRLPEALPPGLHPEGNIGHAIPLEPGSKPPFRHAYRLSPRELAEADSGIADVVAHGYAVPGTLPYSSSILFIQKKDGTLSMCVDYCALNKLTVKNKYALPRIDDLLDQLQGSNVFSSLDLTSGYQQHSDITGGCAKDCLFHFFWHCEFKVLSFGLTNAPATFQAVTNDIFRPCIGKFVLVYLDDILVFSKSPEEHAEHLQLLLQRLHVNMTCMQKVPSVHPISLSMNSWAMLLALKELRLTPKRPLWSRTGLCPRLCLICAHFLG